MAKVVKPSAMTPAEIKSIREDLGLTQAEAGELIGGGLRAFQKYESGTIAPAQAVENLLKVLAENPAARATLIGKRAKPVEVAGLRPYEVTGEHVLALTERKFVALARRLLSMEALRSVIPRDTIQVASNLTAADGGVDGRIEWAGGVERTEFLPSRLCVIQLKAAEISPSEAAKDVINAKTSAVEEGIATALTAGGTYMMLCSRPYVHKLVHSRETAVREAIEATGLSIRSEQIVFRDADQVAAWVNAHPTVATWVLEQTQPGLVGPLKTWSHWAGRHEHSRVPQIEDARLDTLRTSLREQLTEVHSVTRLVGLSGIGKSRLALDALAPTEDEEIAGVKVSDSVLYAMLPEAGSTPVFAAVQTLADSGVRAIIVVDRCDQAAYDALSGMARRASSKLSLLAIDHEIPTAPAPGDIQIEIAPAAVVEGVLASQLPQLPSEDSRRLAAFAGGFPQMAILLSDAWRATNPVANVTNEALVDRIILGRARDGASDPSLKAAMILSAYGLVGYVGDVAGELAVIAEKTRGLTVDDLRAALEELRRRGVVQLRGRFASLQPRPVATALAVRQWAEWGEAAWDELLASDASRPFARRLSKQLTLLNTTEIAVKVAKYICRRGGPLDSYAAIQVEENATLISRMAEIDSRAVADLLDRTLGGLTVAELKTFSGGARRQIVWAVQKIAFVEQTFADGAQLLLSLAMGENESWANNATGQFGALFPVLLADTEAGPNARLEFLDQALATDDAAQLKLVVKALEQGATTTHFSRSVGTESHGLRPALEPWRPRFWNEAWEYVDECLKRLLELALRDDGVGALARQALATDFRALVSAEHLDFVERAVDAVTKKFGALWPEALQELGLVLTYDREAIGSAREARVNAMIQKLSPNDLAHRVRLLVTEMPYDFPCGAKLDWQEKSVKQREAIASLVDDLLADPSVLAEKIVEVSAGSQRMARVFGEIIAERADAPLDWQLPIIRAYLRADTKLRNGDLLVGFISALAAREPDAVDRFKRVALKSGVFAPLVPPMMLQAGISERDIELVLEALKGPKLPTRSLQFWKFGGVLARLAPNIVAPLFSALVQRGGEGWAIAVELFGMYVHSDPGRVNQLRPQLREIVDGVRTAPKRHDTMVDHHFKSEVMNVLSKGRGDADACAMALSLTHSLIGRSSGESYIDDRLITPLVPGLLRDFPEIVWPLMGQAIAADPAMAWRFEHVVSNSFSFDGHGQSALLNLQEDTLFAWAHAYPEVGPAFLAVTIPLLGAAAADGRPRLHPVIERLINEFGEREDVQSALQRNLFTFSWSGSTVSYYAKYILAVEPISKHPKLAVRRWAKRILEGLKASSDRDQMGDDEQEAMWDQG